MRFEIVGLQERSGEYEGRAYNNTIVHVTSTNPNVVGKQTSTIKVKTAVFKNIFISNHNER